MKVGFLKYRDHVTTSPPLREYKQRILFQRLRHLSNFDDRGLLVTEDI